MTPVPPPFHRRARAAWHRAFGWACYRIGAYEAARRRFERVLRLLGGDDFSAYVGLGRVAYKLGDYAGWKRECGHARRTSPDRYAQLKHPFELFEARASESSTPSALNPFGAARDRVGGDSRLPRSEGPAPSRVGNTGPEALPTDMGAAGSTLSAIRDDCTSAPERARFRELGPIPEDAAQDLDVDELIRRLSG